MRRGGQFAAVCTAAVLVLVGCGQRHVPAKPKTPYGGVADLPEKLGADGTTITVGDPEASLTVHLYEDPRCPYCGEFETTGGAPELRDATVQRKARTQYTLASFLDDRLGGTGSKKAVNALRAALAEGKFAEYHAVLYANQPAESVDGYTDASLLKLARQVEGLRSPAFDAAVKSMKYRSFVAASQRAYEQAGGAKEPDGPGTPTAVINDVRIPLKYNGMLYDRTFFSGLLQRIHDDPGQWQDTDL
ncbi:DsbA family protein [Streptomyces sp. NPDC054794]